MTTTWPPITQPMFFLAGMTLGFIMYFRHGHEGMQSVAIRTFKAAAISGIGLMLLRAALTWALS